jgi:hypothetical protein
MLRPGGFLRVRDLFLSCELDEVDTVIEGRGSKGAAECPDQGWTRPELSLSRDPDLKLAWHCVEHEAVGRGRVSTSGPAKAGAVRQCQSDGIAGDLTVSKCWSAAVRMMHKGCSAFHIHRLATT